MKSCWILLSVIRLSLAATQPFSVHNDLLAHPQYEIIYSETYITSIQAKAQLQNYDRRKEGQSVHFEVDAGRNSEQHVLSSGDDATSDEDSLERILLDDRPYLCRIPYVDLRTADNTTRSTTSEEEQKQELIRASDHGWELLRGMQGTCVFYPGGWWTYRFCFDEGVKQFHALPPRPGMPLVKIVEDPAVPSFMLGHMPKSSEAKSKDADAAKTTPDGVRTDISSQLETKGEMKYLVQTLEGGTTCDLTGKPRKIEVQFHCNPGSLDQISLIKETASCVYLMIIQTPRLCNDVAFLPPQDEQAHQITCQPILEPHEETEWKALTKEFAENELFLSEPVTSEQPKKIVIGGIEVGAQVHVGGSPERTIKASNTVQPKDRFGDSKDRYIATLAKSDGKYTTIMSEGEIKKHGLNRKSEEVNELIKNIQQWAGEGQPWKLDMLHTPEGFEFRGVLLDSLDEGAKKPEEEKAETTKNEENRENEQKPSDESGRGP